MRVVTLLPAATEIVAGVGAGAELVGVSHECDHPPGIEHLPRLTATPLDVSASGATIDAEVRRLRETGKPVIAVDAAALRRLAPDLIVTQSLCEVCAVSDGEVHRLGAALPNPPRIIALGAGTLAGIEEDIRAVGRALGREPGAEALIAEMRDRLARLRGRERARPARVLCIEWLEPLYLAGHWVPELVAAAGGVDVGAAPGSHSRLCTWGQARDLAPDLIAVMLCGFGVERAVRELAALRTPDAHRTLATAPVWVLDGNAYTSRSGPRVVEGAERLHAALHARELPGMLRWTPPWPA